MYRSKFGQENFLGAGGVCYHIGPWPSIDYAYGWRIAQGDSDPSTPAEEIISACC